MNILVILVRKAADPLTMDREEMTGVTVRAAVTAVKAGTDRGTLARKRVLP